MKYQVIEIIHKVNIIEAKSEDEAAKKFYEKYTEAEVSNEEVEVHPYEAAENLGGGALADELESVARLAAKLEGGPIGAPPDAETREKADLYLLEYLAEIQRGNRHASDLADWLVQNLPAEAVKGLAQDWDDSQADRPQDEGEDA